MVRRYSIVTDLSFGDSGKGKKVDYLARSHGGSTTVFLTNGGAQSGHNVVTPAGQHHCFQQLSSASFNPAVTTYISEYRLFDPYVLQDEIARFKTVQPNKFVNVMVDARAKVVTPFHKAANKLREWGRDAAHHGSCGYGIGETMGDSIDHPEDTIYVSELRRQTGLITTDALRTLTDKLHRIQERKRTELAEIIERAQAAGVLTTPCSHLLDEVNVNHVAKYFTEVCFWMTTTNHETTFKMIRNLSDHIIFEGSQGVLLDEDHGFHPYTTWSRCTNQNALALVDELGIDRSDVHKYGLCRAYTTRHGAGPLPTENPKRFSEFSDPNNPFNPWQENMRFGDLDFALLRYAIDACKDEIDSIVVSHVDQMIGRDLYARKPISYGIANHTMEPGSQERLTMQSDLAEIFRMDPMDTYTRLSDFQMEKLPMLVDAFQDYLKRPVSHVFAGPTANDLVKLDVLA